MIDLWFVGKSIVDDKGNELGWMVEGVYELEEDAARNAGEEDFIVLAGANMKLPAEAFNCRKFYYPKLETWEDSVLCKHQSNSGPLTPTKHFNTKFPITLDQLKQAVIYAEEHGLSEFKTIDMWIGNSSGIGYGVEVKNSEQSEWVDLTNLDSW